MSKDPSPSPETPEGAPYTLEMVARITRLPAEEIVVYYRSGIISPVAAPEESALLFDETAILQLRRIAQLLSEYRLNHAGLRMMTELWREIESLRAEVRFLRERN
jgi:DNA-binding transcriptional MerR regulator